MATWVMASEEEEVVLEGGVKDWSVERCGW